MKKLLTIVAISALTLSTLVGCGKKDEPTTVEPTVTTEVTAEPTVEHTTEVKNTADIVIPDTTVETPEVEDVDLTGYLVDYPLTAGDKKVLVKLPEEFNFYPDVDFYGQTYSEYFKEYNYIVCYKSIEDAKTINEVPQLQITSDCIANVNWFIENAETGYGDNTFEINTINEYNNGITTYEIISHYKDFDSYMYIVDWKVDDHICQILIQGVDKDEINEIFDFYGNSANSVIVQ